MYTLDRYLLEPSSDTPSSDIPIAFRIDFLDIIYYSQFLNLYELKPENNLFTNLKIVSPVVVEKLKERSRANLLRLN